MSGAPTSSPDAYTTQLLYRTDPAMDERRPGRRRHGRPEPAARQAGDDGVLIATQAAREGVHVDAASDAP